MQAYGSGELMMWKKTINIIGKHDQARLADIIDVIVNSATYS